MNKLYYKGFETTIYFDYDSKCLYGKLENIPDLVTFESNNAKEIEYEFHKAVEDYLYMKNGNQLDIWTFSDHRDDNWDIIETFPTFQACYDYVNNMLQPKPFYLCIGKLEVAPIPEIPTDEMLEKVDQLYADQVDIDVNDYLFDNLSNEQYEELHKEVNTVFQQWLTKNHIKSNSFLVGQIKEFQYKDDKYMELKNEEE